MGLKHVYIVQTNLGQTQVLIAKSVVRAEIVSVYAIGKDETEAEAIEAMTAHLKSLGYRANNRTNVYKNELEFDPNP